MMIMDLNEAFWKLHSSLPRQSPGSDSATRSMLRLAGGAPKFHKALDIGCGPGRASIILASQGIQVTAVDINDSFLEQLKQRVAAQNLANLEVRHADMASLPFDERSFDLIWAEGSVYALGWETALVSWSRFLADNGMLVVTDCNWLTQSPTDEAWAFWQQAYPRMLSVPQARYAAEKAGFKVEHVYFVSDNDWFEEYLNPLSQQHELFKDNPDSNIQKAIAVGRSQIYLREKYPKEYGYVGYVLKKLPTKKH